MSALNWPLWHTPAPAPQGHKHPLLTHPHMCTILIKNRRWQSNYILEPRLLHSPDDRFFFNSSHQQFSFLSRLSSCPHPYSWVSATGTCLPAMSSLKFHCPSTVHSFFTHHPANLLGLHDLVCLVEGEDSKRMPRRQEAFGCRTPSILL
jgi:hypothetical protein